MSILIDRDTTFIVQGITGREAVSLTRENLAYGSRIVGGVTPGRAGRDVYGVPVYDCVRDITKDQKVTGSIVCVPPNFTKDAVFEAIENGIELVVVVTERVPRREVAQCVELAKLRGARIIGPNCLGLISPGPEGEGIKMGGIGGPARRGLCGILRPQMGRRSPSGIRPAAQVDDPAPDPDAWAPRPDCLIPTINPRPIRVLARDLRPAHPI